MSLPQNTTINNFRYHVKIGLLSKVYLKGYALWNKRLKKLAIDNASSLDRWIGGKIPVNYGIYFKNKRWYTEEILWIEEPSNPFCFELNPDYPEFTERMTEIAEELGPIRTECYESGRFLTGLLLYPAPAESLEAVLGNTLFSAGAKDFRVHAERCGETWNENHEVALRTFVNEHRNIVQKMNERLVLNLITMDT